MIASIRQQTVANGLGWQKCKEREREGNRPPLRNGFLTRRPPRSSNDFFRRPPLALPTLASCAWCTGSTGDQVCRARASTAAQTAPRACLPESEREGHVRRCDCAAGRGARQLAAAAAAPWPRVPSAPPSSSVRSPTVGTHRARRRRPQTQSRPRSCCKSRRPRSSPSSTAGARGPPSLCRGGSRGGGGAVSAGAQLCWKVGRPAALALRPHYAPRKVTGTPRTSCSTGDSRPLT